MSEKPRMLDVPELVTQATAGAHINACMREAIVLCATEWRNVRFTHNGKTYCVRCNDLLSAIEQTNAGSAQ